MNRIVQKVIISTAGLAIAVGAVACSHGYVDVRGTDRPDGYAQVDIVGVDGYKHHGYYDRDHAWHGGWYDNDRHFHDDPRDWRH